MGKWSQVRCNCHNRLPLLNNAWCDRPYQNCPQKRLSSRQKAEVVDWQQNIEGMYQCGHHHGMLVQLYPGNIIKLGSAIKQVFADNSLFEIYPTVSDWRNYFSPGFNEELHISPQEAELWLMEATELEQAFSTQENLLYNKVQQILNILFYREAKANRSLNRFFNSLEKIEFTQAVKLLNNLDDLQISRDSILQT